MTRIRSFSLSGSILTAGNDLGSPDIALLLTIRSLISLIMYCLISSLPKAWILVLTPAKLVFLGKKVYKISSVFNDH